MVTFNVSTRTWDKEAKETAFFSISFFEPTYIEFDIGYVSTNIYAKRDDFSFKIKFSLSVQQYTFIFCIWC